MSYCRVIPRDLFNEGNLLKCYGRLYINLENENLPNVELIHDGEAFDVQLNEYDGSLYLANVILSVNEVPCQLSRPMNSREAWPLRLITDNEEEVQVFAEDGSFSTEMLDFLKGQSD